MKSVWMLILGVSVVLIVPRRVRPESGAGRRRLHPRAPVAAVSNTQARQTDWTMIDERSDQSFPASDPPGTY